MQELDQELEDVLANPPKLKEVLETPILFDSFYWFQVSRFAPENLLFRSAVMGYKQSVSKNAMEKAQQEREYILTTFMADDAVFQVPSRKTRQELQETGCTLELFDEALAHVERDLGRSLQVFYGSPIFRSVYTKRKQLEAIVRSHNSNRGDPTPVIAKSTEQPTIREKNEALLSSIRKAFGLSAKLGMVRSYEVSSPYQYKVLDTSTEERPQKGWVRHVEDEFRFYNMEEMELCRAPAAVFLGLEKSAIDNMNNGMNNNNNNNINNNNNTELPGEVDLDHGVSGCCGTPKVPRNRSGSGVSSLKVDDKGWMVKGGPSDEEVGPLDLATLLLWWKFHLLPETALIRSAAGEYKPVREVDTVFPISAQIRLVDPTTLNDML